MRFSGFSSRVPSFRLGTPLGEHKVVVTVAAGAVCLKTRGGEVGIPCRFAVPFAVDNEGLHPKS